MTDTESPSANVLCSISALILLYEKKKKLLESNMDEIFRGNGGFASLNEVDKHINSSKELYAIKCEIEELLDDADSLQWLEQFKGVEDGDTEDSRKIKAEQYDSLLHEKYVKADAIQLKIEILECELEDLQRQKQDLDNYGRALFLRWEEVSGILDLEDDPDYDPLNNVEAETTGKLDDLKSRLHMVNVTIERS
ncbi:MAG: hypothetical protein VB020_04540 [Methanocorpusculum sp.]|nr:hypothetical protein [Methanocorpusculum sp.]